MPHRGKLVVLSFFFLGLALAGGAIWYHFAKSRWAMAFWQTDAARLLARAPEVELWKLTPATGSGESADSLDATPAGERESLVIDGQTLWVAQRRRMTNAPGLIHMRMALVEDANFDTQAAYPPNPRWDYALRFTGEDPHQSLIVVIDSQHGLVRRGEPSDAPAASVSPIAKGLRRFVREPFVEQRNAKREFETSNPE